MKLAFVRSGVALVFATLLQACGGGGGGDGDGNGGSSARLSVSTSNVAVEATPGEATPTGSVTVTVSNPPAAGVFFDGTYTALGVEFVDFSPSSATSGTLNFVFRSPGSLQNGSYTDSVTIRGCIDAGCSTEISGSPKTINLTYEVTGTGVATATIDRTAIELALDSRDSRAPTETTRISLSQSTATPVWVDSTRGGSPSIQFVSHQQTSATTTDFSIQFQAGTALNSGIYNENIGLRVCYDQSCVRQVAGSPFSVTTRVTVDTGTEPGFDPLVVENQVALPHDVIDAEFSKALNAVVMVGSFPVSALYVYDVATGAESQQILNQVPNAVSVGPNGLTAAVGHDAHIAIVDLTTVGQAGAPAPIILDVSADVLDVVLAGNGYVHAFPRVDQWQSVHSVEIATNTERLSLGTIYAGALGRLHPSGDFLYTASNGLSPSDIEKWDVTANTATVLYDSPYHGDHEMCGNLWFNESGTTIYTVCGNTFRSSPSQAQDMIYSGALALTTGSFYWFTIRSLSQSDARGEVVLIEHLRASCDPNPWSSEPCYSHLATYESDFLNRLSVYSIAPVTVAGGTYAHQGLFVFHDTAGKKYLIGKLEGMPNPETEYFLSVID